MRVSWLLPLTLATSLVLSSRPAESQEPPTPPTPETPAPPPGTPATEPAQPAPSAAPVVAPAPPALAVPAPPAAEPLAGWSDQQAFLRSADGEFVFFPNGRLNIDAYFYKRESARMPTDSLILRRARLEAFGWIGSVVGFNIAGEFAAAQPAGADPVAQSWLVSTDDYLLFAPHHDNLVLVQIGQFDAPFTFENRTSDKYVDFMERSLTVRAFGIPTQKEVGGMVNGLLPHGEAYYSVGLFNGDGQNFRNVDNNVDLIGRLWVAPLHLLGPGGALEEAEVGGSFWIGARGGNGLPLARMTTQGGFGFTSSQWTYGMAKTPLELHQHHDLAAFGLETNVPIAHRFGVRVEYVHKSQDLDIDDVSMASAGKLSILGSAKLEGWSIYGQLWWWILGDDRIGPPGGLQLPPRLKRFQTTAPRHGLMLATRVERLDFDITSATPLDGPSVGTPESGSHTLVTSWELGLNYWYSKRFRVMADYLLNVLDGGAAAVKSAIGQNGGNHDEHELLFRLGVQL